MYVSKYNKSWGLRDLYKAQTEGLWDRWAFCQALTFSELRLKFKKNKRKN
jgi:hypothetical protein